MIRTSPIIWWRLRLVGSFKFQSSAHHQLMWQCVAVRCSHHIYDDPHITNYMILVMYHPPIPNYIIAMIYMVERNDAYDIEFVRCRCLVKRSPWFRPSTSPTGWRRIIRCPKLQIIFHKRATKYRSLLRKMTYKDKGSYESWPPCKSFEKTRGRDLCILLVLWGGFD